MLTDGAVRGTGVTDDTACLRLVNGNGTGVHAVSVEYRSLCVNTAGDTACVVGGRGDRTRVYAAFEGCVTDVFGNADDTAGTTTGECAGVDTAVEFKRTVFAGDGCNDTADSGVGNARQSAGVETVLNDGLVCEGLSDETADLTALELCVVHTVLEGYGGAAADKAEKAAYMALLCGERSIVDNVFDYNVACCLSKYAHVESGFFFINDFACEDEILDRSTVQVFKNRGGDSQLVAVTVEGAGEFRRIGAVESNVSCEIVSTFARDLREINSIIDCGRVRGNLGAGIFGRDSKHADCCNREEHQDGERNRNNSAHSVSTFLSV